MQNAKEKDIELAIIKTFNLARQAQDSSFDEERFLDFLMKDNRPLKDVRNSFRALRRLNKFYDLLQLECGVCLDLDDSEKNWSVRKLTSHIAKKKNNPSAQKTLVKKRCDRAVSNMFYEPVKFGLFVIIPVTVVLYGTFHTTPFGLVFPVLGLLGI